jgi:hypothetical protein
MTRTLRPPATLAIVAMVAAISAGCGGTDSSGGTSTAASAGKTGTASSGDTGGKQNSTAREKAVKFAACMRENGYADFPDPKASGEFPTFGISVTGAVWLRALRACKELQPPGSLSAERSPEQQSAALRFAQCVREHGVPDFPDPVKGEPLIDTYKIPSSNKPGGMAILNAATAKCGDLVNEAMGGQG